MAFRKTQGRTVRVSPTGMPDLSGYRQAAAVYDQISQSMFEVGADMRQSNLNNLIIEAEAAGRTAGATYDKDNNIVPLTNLDLDSAIEGRAVGNKEKEALRKAYRQSAIKTYQQSISLDADTFADNVLLNNPNNPSKVRGAFEGYIEGLELPDDVAPYVLPSITRSFVIAENRAKANLITQQKQATERINLDGIKKNYERLGTLISKGSGTNPAVAAGHQKMIDEINQDIEGSLDALRTVGYDDAQIAALREAGALNIAIKSSTAHVERIYQTSGAVQALQEALNIKKEFAEDPNVDGDAVYKIMSSHIASLSQVDTAVRQDRQRQLAENFGSAKLGIGTGLITSPEQILALDVSDADKSVLLNQLVTVNSGIETQRKAAADAEARYRKDQFDRLIGPFERNVLPTMDERERNALQNERMRNASIASLMYQKGLISPGDWNKFVKAADGVVVNAIKSNADSQFAELETYMSKDSGYALPVQTLKDMTPSLISNGYVGDTSLGAKYSEAAWSKRIEEYANSRSSYLAAQQKIAAAENRVRNRDNPSADDVDTVASNRAWALEYDEKGDSLYHSDPAVREENFALVTEFALAYGVMHPDAQNALQGLRASIQNPDVFDAKIQLFSKLFSSISSGSVSGGISDFGLGDIEASRIMNKAGINVLDYEVARIVGFQKFQDSLNVSETVNADRITRNIEAEFGSIEEAIDQNFDGALQQGLVEQLMNTLVIGPGGGSSLPNAREMKAFQTMLNNSPGEASIKGAYLGDERIQRYMELYVTKKFASKNIPITPETMKATIREGVVEISDSLGMSIDSDGNAYFAYKPWYMSAKSSMGDAVSIIPDVSEAVYDDIRYQVLTASGGAGLSPRIQEILKEDGIIRLDANVLSGPEQTYTVSVEDPDTGQIHNIIPFYRYDFNNSLQNPAYLAAIERVNNGTIKQFLITASLGMLKPTLIRGQLENIIGDLNNDANFIGMNEPDKFIGLMETLQGLNAAANPFAGPEVDKQIDARDVQLLRDFLFREFRDYEEYQKKLRELYK